MKIKTLGLAVWLLGSSQVAFAASFEVSDIRVEGLQRVSAGTVFNVLPFTARQTIDENALSSAGQALFRTGLFDDVSFDRDGNVLVVRVQERPSIAQINITGNRQISTDDLRNGLNQTGISEGQVLQRSTLEEVQRELEQVYQGQGRYSARITTSVVNLDSNRAQVNINIDEGAVARIQQINLVGNHAFSDDELRRQFELADKPGWFFGWFSSDRYSREALTGDLDRLRAFYLDRGYVNFNITSTQVSISPDKSAIYVTVNLDEGDRYTIDKINFAGSLEMSEERARSLVTAQPGQVYNQSLLTQSSEALRQALGNEGFTFANVDAVPRVNENGDTVDVTFNVDPGQRAYVRRVNFRGNTTTADEVLRRELVQMEGAPASAESIRQSQERLQRLGFFSQVEVETTPVAGESDQLDVNYNVTEQPSGSISASVGFAQSEGIIYGASLSQSNFLGSGNRVDIGAQQSRYYTSLRFSFTDPYWTLSGISRGYDVYYRSTDYEDSDISTYSSDAIGGGINFGYPISDLSRLNFGLGVEHLTLDTYTDTPEEIYRYVQNEGDTFDSYKLTTSWTRNNLNRGVLPTSGSYQQVALEAAGPGSDAEFFKLRYRGQKLFELNPEWALKFRTELGYADSYGDTDVYPFFENFYAGGLGSVRGFRSNTLGQRTTARGDGDEDTLGGNILIEGSAELIFPLPFIEDRRQLQSSFFFDTGNTYLSDCYATGDTASQCSSGIDLGELRYSVGVGLSWLTPVGPLTFSLAQPLNRKSDDESQVFQFSLGQTF
ncbi:outer membrane protein assembly factor BamA [Halotalea alkalilenta]|uniref:outer membrane protein assembly factor BamA n=1 Tax=Halotalea alkalilenta TaxID=376489 RepID=UPI000A985021|nr:outer membrane protein assembly factor BamA [Halotalea alkalilenta]